MKSSEKKSAVIEHPHRVVETGGQFKHVMAITLDPTSDYREGIIRCITNRSGDLGFEGNVDRSELYRVKGDSLERFKIGDRLKVKSEAKILKEVVPEGADLLGLEDPDIWVDERTGLTHVYFTIPFRRKPHHTSINLGHAAGRNLDSLEMTMPVLTADENGSGAKEVSIAPLNKQGFRYNLIESGERSKDVSYSTVRVAVANDMGRPWKFGNTVFHPAEHNIPWIAGHASPGPLLPKSFIDLGEDKMLGIMNGREANQKIGGGIKYGVFSVGLFIYDFENGKIEWVSTEPLIRDSEAKTITFASQFVETSKGAGILYAHVDDSFVRAYTLNAEAIRSLLPFSALT